MQGCVSTKSTSLELGCLRYISVVRLKVKGYHCKHSIPKKLPSYPATPSMVSAYVLLGL